MDLKVHKKKVGKEKRVNGEERKEKKVDRKEVKRMENMNGRKFGEGRKWEVIDGWDRRRKNEGKV